MCLRFMNKKSLVISLVACFSLTPFLLLMLWGPEPMQSRWSSMSRRAIAAPAPCIYVVGLEGSGTRFISSGIARLLIPRSQQDLYQWDGEDPPVRAFEAR